MKAAEYYRDVLGFRIVGEPHGDPPCFIFVGRHYVEFMLKLAESPEQVQPNGAHGVWDAYVWIDSWEAMREELKCRGAG